MVKLRGVNVFPEAIGEIDRRSSPLQWRIRLCRRASTAPARDEMTVMVERRTRRHDSPRIAADLAARFTRSLGVKLTLKVSAPAS